MLIDANAAVAPTALALSMPATAIQRCEPAEDLTPMARAELTAVFMDDESSPAAGRSLSGRRPSESRAWVAIDSTGWSLRIPVAEITLRMPVYPLR